MDPILDDLNPAQRQAVEFGAGPLMVLAGAGSGKTRVITRRIAMLLRNAVAPHQILGLTFTNKAAQEMAGRVQELGGYRVRVTTFHSSCARFLREDGRELGYPRDFSIYDTYDRDSCIKILMRELQVPGRNAVKPSHVGRVISRLKNVMVRPDEFDGGHTEAELVARQIYAPYEERMRRLGAMDFDDLLLRFLDLLREFPEVAERYRERFQWVLVDEFQDTNRVQYELIKALVGERGNLCVVGDPDQSIYKFRGADIRNILDLEQDYPKLTMIPLEQNYRSTRCILRAAENVIRNNLRRKDKSLRCQDNEEGEPLQRVRAPDPAGEAREIVHRIEVLLGAGVFPNEIAVFYRTHFLSRGIEEALRRRGLEYEVIGGLSFFERREIKDLLAYLRVIVNPLDDVSMERIINVPTRGVGKVSLDKLRTRAADEQMALSEIIQEPSLLHGISARAKKSLAQLADLICAARDVAARSAGDALGIVLERTQYVDHACALGDPEDVAREENIGELVTDSMDFDAEHGTGLSGYLAHVSLLTSEDRATRGPRVSLMSVHAAKGLEFDHVFVAGLEDGIFPHSRSEQDAAELEEERRLMYVALTRARKTATLSHSARRVVQGLLMPQRESRFLGEIPPECFGEDIEPRQHWEPDESHGEYAEFDEFCDPDEAAELRPGSRVIHSVFGPGEVVSIQGRGGHARAGVRFRDGQVRIVLQDHGNLQIIPETGEA